MRFSTRVARAAAALTSVATCGLLVALALPAPSYAADPPLPDLTPVAGSANGGDAPTVTTGRYVDKVRANGDVNIYSVVRKVPGSTILFGATLLREDGFRRSNRLALVMAYADKKAEDGIVRCGSSGSFEPVSPGTVPVSTAVGFTFTNRDCATRDSLFLTVRAATTTGIPVGAPYELDVWEVPPVTNSADLPEFGSASASSDEVEITAPTQQVEPGPWSAEAARLPANETVYVDLPLGKVAWFAVDVPFNNALDAIATVADPAGTSQGASVELRIASPVGGFVGDKSYAPDAALEETATIGTRPVSVESQTSLVSPKVRAGGRSQGLTDRAAQSSQPGTYAIAVYVPNTTGDPDATLPMTLTAGVLRGTGTFAKGDDAPAYDGTLTEFPTPDGPTPTAFDPDRASAGSDGGSDSGSDSGSDGGADEPEAAEGGDHDGLAYGLTGGAAVLVLLGAAVLLTGRRAGREA